MARSLEEVERDARALEPSDRAILVERLLGTLDEGEDENAEEAWLAEAERRYEAYRAGGTKAIHAEQVFAEAEARLARQKRP